MGFARPSLRYGVGLIHRHIKFLYRTNAYVRYTRKFRG
jgi:hypothetical protein